MRKKESLHWQVRAVKSNGNGERGFVNCEILLLQSSRGPSQEFGNSILASDRALVYSSRSSSEAISGNL